MEEEGCHAPSCKEVRTVAPSCKGVRTVAPSCKEGVRTAALSWVIITVTLHKWVVRLKEDMLLRGEVRNLEIEVEVTLRT